jgi:5-methylcytosine-specific restriction endonuclease McrA
MNHAEDFLALIPSAVVREENLRSVGLTAEEAIRNLTSLAAMGSKDLQVAVVQVLLRALETYILADDELLNLSRYRELLLGQEDAHIERRVKELLGVAPPVQLTMYLKRCLTSGPASSSTGQKATVPIFVQQTVLKQSVESHPRRELRCVVCGYHFLASDVGLKLDRLRDLGAIFSTSPEPGRLEDELKPRDLTQLELDHIVPEYGFGWSDADNLQACCMFCNGGRLIFRRALEPLSTMIAASLGIHPPSRRHGRARQVIVVAKLLHSMGRCSFCGTTRQDAELTVQLKDPSVPSRYWFVPWNLEITCYRCHS